MMMRRGLSLLEVLAAVVLIAIVASACLPLLQEGLTRLGRPDASGVSLHELSIRADELLGGDPFDVVDRGAALTFPWPDHPERTAVTVTLAVSKDDTHEWLIFTCGDVATARWRKRDAVEEGGS